MWEILPGSIGIHHNLNVMGLKHGVVIDAITHIVAISFPLGDNSKMKTFKAGDVGTAKTWLTTEVLTFYQNALAQISISDVPQSKEELTNG